MTELGRILLPLTVAVPLALVLLAPFVPRPLRLLPWAAAPGIAAALLAPFGAMVEFPMLLLGLTLQLDRIGAVFLGFGTLLWCLAGSYAGGYLAQTEREASFTMFWLLTLAGTLGTFIAADLVTFYAAFAVMSLATYGLVIHDRTQSARHAGRVYIAMAVLGETTLVAAFMLAASNADSLLLTEVRAALANSPWSDYILAGLLVGFGIKAGLVPLHMWLPLAHPQAPTPASAALSGVIVKAGIIGLMRLLPGEGLSPAWADALIVLGLVTAYYGVAAGLLQAEAKAILAYSTLSQMGLVVSVLASGLAGPDGARTLDVVTLYATHHGLAKGALFLAVGVVAASGAAARRPVMALTALLALAIAGLPLSGGALAKLALKEAPAEPAVGLLVTLSAVGTTLLMLRFLSVVWRSTRDDAAVPSWRLVVPWGAAAAAAVALPWLLFSDLAGQPAWYAMTPANLWSALWPILLALIPAIVVSQRRWGLPFLLPQGDIVVIAEKLVRGVRRVAAWLDTAPARLPHRHGVPAWLSLAGLETAENALRGWTVSGPVLILVALLIGLVLVI
jgi:hydrogenase-4 component B